MTLTKHTAQGPLIYACVASALMLPPTWALSGAWYSIAPLILVLIPLRAWGLSRTRGSALSRLFAASVALTIINLGAAYAASAPNGLLQLLTVLFLLATMTVLLFQVRKEYLDGRF